MPMLTWLAVPPWSRRPPFTLPARIFGLVVLILALCGVLLDLLVAVVLVLVFVVLKLPGTFPPNLSGELLLLGGLSALPATLGVLGAYLMYRGRPGGRVMLAVAIELALVVTFVALVRGDETSLNGSVVIALLVAAHYLNSVCRYEGETLSGGQGAVGR